MSDRLLSRWRKACERWRSRLFLNSWYLDISVSNRKAKLKMHGTENSNAGAQTVLTPAYRKAEVTLFRDTLSDRELNEYACHEMAHLLVGKLQVLAKEAILEMPKAKQDGWLRRMSETTEETTQQLESVFLWSVKSWKDA